MPEQQCVESWDDDLEETGKVLAPGCTRTQIEYLDAGRTPLNELAECFFNATDRDGAIDHLEGYGSVWFAERPDTLAEDVIVRKNALQRWDTRAIDWRTMAIFGRGGSAYDDTPSDAGFGEFLDLL